MNTIIPNIGRGLLAAALLSLSALGLHAGDFTITKTMLDANNGYIDFNATSIGGVPVTLGPGDTIFIEPHTRAQIVISRVTQGSATQPITITNAATGQFIIDTTNTATPKGITFAGCHDFILKGTPVNGDDGIKIVHTPSGASGITVTQHGDNSHLPITGSFNFELSDMEISGTGFAGVFVKCDLLPASSGFVMTNVKVHDLNIHDTGGEGMYIGSSYFVTQDPHEIHGIEIYHNLVTNTGWDGIQLGCATQNASIHHNRIVGYGVLAGTDPYQDEGIRSNPGTAADIYNNLIVGDPAYAGTGILADPYNSVKYYNNVIVGTAENGIYILETTQTKGYVNNYSVEIMNNTIVSTGTTGVEFSATSHSSNDRLVNNIIAAPGNGIYKNIPTSLFTQIATNTESATVSGVGFVDPTNLKYRLLPTSASVNTGTNVAARGVTTDYDDIARPQGSAYDVGAYEYGTLYSVANITSDTSLSTHVSTANSYTHKINLNASSTVAVNGVNFDYGTGNGSGTQSAKSYTLTSFSYTDTTFNSTATGNIHTVLATRGTNTSSATYTLTLTGLTPGERYTFALFNDSSHSAGRGWYRISQNIDSSTFDLDFSAAGVNTSRALSVNYTATSSSVTFTFTRLDGVGTTSSSSWIGFAGFVNYIEPF